MDKGFILHNSHDLYYRNPFGAVPTKSKVDIRVSINTNLHRHEKPKKVVLRVWEEECREVCYEMELKEEKHGICLYESTINIPEKSGLLWYYFIISFNHKTYYYGNNNYEQGGIGTLSDFAPLSYQVSIYEADAKTPDWLKNAVIYQIFPDRFYNGEPDGKILNPREGILLHSSWYDSPVYAKEVKTGAMMAYDFFGGNLAGVVAKLPYLKDLGVNVIYFNPIFESVSNHRYDTADYKKIDRMLGDNEFFAELCAKAKEMGMNVILDGVFSHTGEDSIYFNKYGNYQVEGACQSTNSPYYPWYKFMSYPDVYESWWGIGTMPNVNETEPSYLDYIIENEDSVINHWQKHGIKGWRLDVADELPLEFLQRLYRKIKELDKDSIIIGEVWEDASHKIAYGQLRQYFDGHHIDSVMNYPFRENLINFLLENSNAWAVKNTLLSLYENYPKENFYANMNIIGTHDVTRILTIFGEDTAADQENFTPYKHKMPLKNRALAVRRLKLASLMQMTFPGAPTIYYGDEAGLEGYTDPYNRGTYPWGREDQDLLTWYKKIVALRNKYPVFRTGEWVPIAANNNVFGYIRYIKGGQDVFGNLHEDNVALVLLNNSKSHMQHISININEWVDDQEYLIDILDSNKYVHLDDTGNLKISLKPLEGKVFMKSLQEPAPKGTRASGVLMHITSLPSRYGVGGLGNSAYEFADFLKASDQKLWQILPINPPGMGESPYQSLSAFAGNPMFISPGKLIEMKLLSKNDALSFLGEKNLVKTNKINFSKAKEIKNKIFKLAFENFKSNPFPKDYLDFIFKESNWLEDYSLFMALKEHFDGKPWNKWDKAIASRTEEAIAGYSKILAEKIEYHKFLQYIFSKQWKDFRKYVNILDIKLVGDLPIFVSHDSADVWSNQHYFDLDKDGNMNNVAGVPPDYFSETGQLWGNPLYRFDLMAKDHYIWWQERIKHLLSFVDIIRIDHFRGFESYWQVPSKEKTAINGKWTPGPGAQFFKVLEEYLGELPIIAEDLGVITPAVNKLKNKVGFPGMRILQFSFSSDEKAACDFPYNINRNTVAYTGTHDNDTLLGWWKSVKKDDVNLYKNILNHLRKLEIDVSGLTQDEDFCKKLIELTYLSNADTVILPIQDILFLDEDSRMNTPGTVGQNNWSWFLDYDSLTADVVRKLKEWTWLSNRN
ncbi:4-alpha-glucanotransferase [Selenomonadales bacterium OttesenSCG-928-I06]|nr:4-alpha-glucanotransferase [Selenomonadales bacterium OttesenSCG-928-I06]